MISVPCTAANNDAEKTDSHFEIPAKWLSAFFEPFSIHEYQSSGPISLVYAL
jgi:hypothetical protein